MSQKAPTDKSDGADKPRRGRPAKADKATHGKAVAPSGIKSPKVDRLRKRPLPRTRPLPPLEQPPAPRDSSRREKEAVVYLNQTELHPFKNHPFGVRDNAEMQRLVESVKASSVN